METRVSSCSTCRFFCQETDPENRLYFDSKSGECRALPPKDHFVWPKTRTYHWCGKWQPEVQKKLVWQKISSHSLSEEPIILYRKGKFCRKSGMLVGYWNAVFKKWHDDGDQLIDKDQITDWMPLPDPPKY